MTKAPRVEGKDVVAALKRGGFRVTHIRGSHHYLHGSGSGLVCVPVHSGVVVDMKTLKSILDQAGLDMDKFLALL